jgi:hypothetical protein
MPYSRFHCAGTLILIWGAESPGCASRGGWVNRFMPSILGRPSPTSWRRNRAPTADPSSNSRAHRVLLHVLLCWILFLRCTDLVQSIIDVFESDRDPEPSQNMTPCLFRHLIRQRYTSVLRVGTALLLPVYHHTNTSSWDTFSSITHLPSKHNVLESCSLSGVGPSTSRTSNFSGSDIRGASEP